MTLFSKFGYAFKNTALLRQALTHKSYHNENVQESVGHNELLEFLGDAVLDLSLSSDLMRRFPQLDEGELSKIRASLVNEKTLAELAQELEIDKSLLLGKGEQVTGGSTKPRLLASAFEAILGAVFQDSDYQKVDEFIRALFTERIEKLDLMNHFKDDYKTRLQEKLQGAETKRTPIYELEREEGPDHSKCFYVAIKIGDKVVAQGQGRSKKQAEQEAARLALEVL